MKPRFVLLGSWAFLAIVLGSMRTPVASGCSFRKSNVQPVMYRQQLFRSSQMPQSFPKHSLSYYDAVFAGRPTSIEDVNRYGKRVTFQVTRVWQGNIGLTIIVFGDFCNGYSTGREQTIFALWDGDKFVDKTYDDQGFLPDLPNNPRGPNLAKIGDYPLGRSLSVDFFCLWQRFGVSQKS